MSMHASRSSAAAPAFNSVSSDLSRRAAVVNIAGNLRSHLPPAILKDSHSDARSTQDFSTVPAQAAQPIGPIGSSENDAKGISGSGTGTVTTTYTPEASDKSTKIVFIQVMRESLDGVPSKPSALNADFAYQDADTTSSFYHVDYVAGEKDPYYNGDDAGDVGTQGNALTKTPASTTDTPTASDAKFPAGSTTKLWEFRTAAFSAAGADAGTYYGYSDWTYSKDKGKPDATATTGTGSGGPGSNFTAAVDLFNTNHGFKMPGGGLGAGAIAGIVLGAIAGAALVGVGIAALAGAF